MFPVICGSELRRAELRTVRPVSLLPRCCKQAPARCFLSRVKFNVKNPGGKNSAKNNFFRPSSQVPNKLLPSQLRQKVSCGRWTGAEQTDGRRTQDGWFYVPLRCWKVCVCPPCCASLLRSPPPAAENAPVPVSWLLLVNTSHWNWDTARHCGLFKAAIHSEGGGSQLLLEHSISAFTASTLLFGEHNGTK